MSSHTARTVSYPSHSLLTVALMSKEGKEKRVILVKIWTQNSISIGRKLHMVNLTSMEWENILYSCTWQEGELKKIINYYSNQ